MNRALAEFDDSALIGAHSIATIRLRAALRESDEETLIATAGAAFAITWEMHQRQLVDDAEFVAASRAYFQASRKAVS